jgi:hypothetical protein
MHSHCGNHGLENQEGAAHMHLTYRIITSGLGYWLPKGLGYTENAEEAGVFTLDDMKLLNLDGCTLERIW